MKKMFNRGFTLIELLVVIAIIGILSSVVLASLNTARSKGTNAAIKSQLANMRAQAELVYDNNTNTYATVCTAGDTTYGGAISRKMYDTAVSNGGAGSAYCNVNGSSAWAASVPLKVAETGGSFWCVDSGGKSAASSGLTGATDYDCP